MGSSALPVEAGPEPMAPSWDESAAIGGVGVPRQWDGDARLWIERLDAVPVLRRVASDVPEPAMSILSRLPGVTIHRRQTADP